MNKKTTIIITIVLVITALILFFLLRNEEKRGLSECEKLTSKIVKEIEDMNYCTSKGDCVLMNGCPYGCNNLINKDADLNKFSELNSEYRNICPDCEQSCRNALKAEEIKCEDGECVSTR